MAGAPLVKSDGLLRRRTGSHARVTFVELFFDLVFVFAVTQISHSLLEHLTWRGAIEATILLAAVWGSWIYTSWGTNWLDPQRVPVRVLLFAMMLLALVMSAALPRAFGDRALGFALPYAAMETGRPLFMVYAAGPGHARLRRNFQRILFWLCLASVGWIAGALVSGGARMGLWLAALGCAYGSPWFGYPTPGLGRSTTEDWNVEGTHIAERCGLFVIIGLGESLLVTGATFAGLEWTPAVIGAMAVALVSAVAMWWLYFDIGAEVGSESIAHHRDPGRLARSAYTFLHIPIVAGIILTAVGDEMVLMHPGGHVETTATLVILGSSALYIGGVTLFKWAVTGALPVSHLVALAGFASLTLVANAVTPLGLAAAAAGVLLGLSWWEGRSGRCEAVPSLTT
jgi:low temperature requirement protein LtrA